MWLKCFCWLGDARLPEALLLFSFAAGTKYSLNHMVDDYYHDEDGGEHEYECDPGWFSHGFGCGYPRGCVESFRYVAT